MSLQANILTISWFIIGFLSALAIMWQVREWTKHVHIAKVARVIVWPIV